MVFLVCRVPVDELDISFLLRFFVFFLQKTHCFLERFEDFRSFFWFIVEEDDGDVGAHAFAGVELFNRVEDLSKREREETN